VPLSTRALLLDEPSRAVVLALGRKRLQSADFADKKHLAERLMACVAAWNEQAHPFRWSTKSVAKVMAKCDNPVVKAA
jgi:uncharacterized protein involved in tolerance to divalent cations